MIYYRQTSGGKGAERAVSVRRLKTPPVYIFHHNISLRAGWSAFAFTGSGIVQRLLFHHGEYSAKRVAVRSVSGNQFLQ